MIKTSTYIIVTTYHIIMLSATSIINMMENIINSGLGRIISKNLVLSYVGSAVSSGKYTYIQGGKSAKRYIPKGKAYLLPYAGKHGIGIAIHRSPYHTYTKYHYVDYLIIA